MVDGQTGVLGRLVHKPVEWQSRHGVELAATQNLLTVDECAWDQIVRKSTVPIYLHVQHRNNPQSMVVGDRGESGENAVLLVEEDIAFEEGNVTIQRR